MKLPVICRLGTNTMWAALKSLNADVKVLSDEELLELGTKYEQYKPKSNMVCGLLATYIKWKRERPEMNRLQFFSLRDDWKTEGTFVAKYEPFDIFVHTLNKTGESLYDLLVKLKPEFPNHFYFDSVQTDNLEQVNKAIKHLEMPITNVVNGTLYYLPKEKAMKFECRCPEDVYVGKLNATHVDWIDDMWPHKYDGSREYFKTFVDQQGGYGVFLKSNGMLVCWILKSYSGVLTHLFTIKEFARKGYASFILKVASRDLAQEGLDVVVCVVDGNNRAESLFRGLEFEAYDGCTFIQCQSESRK